LLAEKSAADVAREKEIREFAKANGWIAEIHYPGPGVVFKKSRQRFFEVAHVFVRFDHVTSVIVNANHCIM